jgi:hypothetical protein
MPTKRRVQLERATSSTSKAENYDSIRETLSPSGRTGQSLSSWLARERGSNPMQRFLGVDEENSRSPYGASKPR